MRAVVFEQYGGRLEVREVPTPRPAPHGVVVRVEATGLCRSDWHGWVGHDPDIVLPHVPGHELAGVVEEIGPAVTNWRPGDRVTVPFVSGCGTCPSCAAGHHQVCEHQTQPGFTHWGSFAQYVALDHADINLVAIPDDLSYATAASLGCRFATAFRAVVQLGRVAPGEWVAVHGCGGVGLSAVMIAAAAGARVVAVDVSPRALELARRFGAAECVRAVVGGSGGFGGAGGASEGATGELGATAGGSGSAAGGSGSAAGGSGSAAGGVGEGDGVHRGAADTPAVAAGTSDTATSARDSDAVEERAGVHGAAIGSPGVAVNAPAPVAAVDTAACVRELTGGGAHLSLDALGSPVTCAASVNSLRRRGRHVQVGLLPSEDGTTPVPMARAIAFELQLLGSHGMAAHTYPEMLEAVRAGVLRPDLLVTSTIGLDAVPKALPELGSAPGSGVTVIEPWA